MPDEVRGRFRNGVVDVKDIEPDVQAQLKREDKERAEREEGEKAAMPKPATEKAKRGVEPRG